MTWSRPLDAFSAGRAGGRRAGGRLRPGRLCAAGSAVVVTLVTLLAGLGVLPTASATGPSGERARDASQPVPASVSPSRSVTSPPGDHGPVGIAGALGALGFPGTSAATALPSGSGSGRRVVFDMSDQRVWLVAASGAVRRTYLVSGSVTDNLHPGTFAVYSTSRWAVGVDDSGVMQYFVRFTRGDHAAIGFHSIPTKNGHALQTRAQLGSPRSHGCIRQWLPDAQRLYEFAPVGTKVVVTA